MDRRRVGCLEGAKGQVKVARRNSYDGAVLVQIKNCLGQIARVLTEVIGCNEICPLQRFLSRHLVCRCGFYSTNYSARVLVLHEFRVVGQSSRSLQVIQGREGRRLSRQRAMLPSAPGWKAAVPGVRRGSNPLP